jgi:hypothetical protein
MIWNLFKKDKEDEDPTIELGQKIQSALQKSEQDKREAEKMVKTIETWAADAIIDNYDEFFPNAHLSFYRDKYKQTAFADYEKIKAKHGQKLPEEVFEKCENIVKGYLNQIELQKAQVLLFEKLYNEHKKTKQKFDAMLARNKRNAEMEKHQERLQEMNNNTTGLGDVYKDEYTLDEINNEFAHQETYFDELHKLKQQYGNDANFENAIAYKDEIEKITNKI